MKTIVLTSLATTVILGLIIGAYFFGTKQNNNKLGERKTVTDNEVSTVTPTDIQTIAPTKDLSSTIASLDDTWNLYTNNKSGFSIRIPKTVGEDMHNNCKIEISDIPVVVFDDSTGSYITVKSFLEYATDSNGEICPKTDNSLDTISERKNPLINNRSNPLFIPINWHIIVAKAENDSEIESFIKTNYGAACKLGAKTLSGNGVYDVKIISDGLDFENSKCIINFALALKYSPHFKKIATWDMGQSIGFSSSKYESYDSKMAESFKFVN